MTPDSDLRELLTAVDRWMLEVEHRQRNLAAAEMALEAAEKRRAGAIHAYLQKVKSIDP